MRLNVKFHETPNLLVGDSWLEYQTFEEETDGIKLRPQLFEAQQSKYKLIESWLSNTTYAVSFDYKLNSGKAAIAIVEDIVGKSKGAKILKVEDVPTVRKILFDEVIDRDVSVVSPASDGWSSYKKTFTSSEDSTNGYLFIYGFSGKNSYSDIEIRNVKVQKIPDPKIIIRKHNISPSISPQIPDIKIETINPTKFKLEITNINGPFYLVFNDTFSTEWKLYLDKKTALKRISPLYKFFETVGMQEIAADTHYTANGYSNGWLITPEHAVDGNLKLIVEFNPQILFYYGIIITSVILSGSIFFLMYAFVIEKIRKTA